jgi:hypothetical protein
VNLRRVTLFVAAVDETGIAAAQAEIAAISPCPNEGCGSNRVVLTTCPNNLMPFGDFAAPGSFCRNCDVPHQ